MMMYEQLDLFAQSRATIFYVLYSLSFSCIALAQTEFKFHSNPITALWKPRAYG